MSLWFSANAVSGQYPRPLGTDPGRGGVAHHHGAARLRGGHRGRGGPQPRRPHRSRWYFAVSALLGAAANAALAWAPDFPPRSSAASPPGVFLAGVYPPAMKMAATWFRSDRGLAIGVIVASLTVGKAMPYLVRSVEPSGVRGRGARRLRRRRHLRPARRRSAIATGRSSFPAGRSPGSWSPAWCGIGRRGSRPPATWATCGSCTRCGPGCRPSWRRASPRRRGRGVRRRAVSVLAFGAIAAGGAGAVWGGWAARRLGYARVVTVAMAISGLCSLAIGLFFGRSLWLLAPVVLRVGLLRGRRLRAVQRDGHGAGAAARRGHRAHPADLARLPAHHGDDPARAGAGDAGGLAAGLPGARAGAGGRHRRDSPAAGLGSLPPLTPDQCVLPPEKHCLQVHACNASSSFLYSAHDGPRPAPRRRRRRCTPKPATAAPRRAASPPPPGSTRSPCSASSAPRTSSCGRRSRAPGRRHRAAARDPTRPAPGAHRLRAGPIWSRCASAPPLIRTCMGEFEEHPDIVAPVDSPGDRAARELAALSRRSAAAETRHRARSTQTGGRPC